MSGDGEKPLEEAPDEEPVEEQPDPAEAAVEVDESVEPVIPPVEIDPFGRFWS